MKESIFKKSTADYSTPSRRRQLVKERFNRVVDAFEAAGRIDALWETERRKKALLTFMEAASGKYKSYAVENVEETFTEFETSNLSTYSLLDENYDFTLAAALWILDELNLSQNLYKAYEYFPASFDLIEDIYTRTNFCHPFYETELVGSVMYILEPDNLTGRTTEAFRNIISLLDSAHVSEAAEYFKGLQWKAIDCLMRTDGYFSKEKEKFRQRVKAMDTRNVLQTDKMAFREESLEEMASDFVDLEEKRTKLIWHFEEYLGSGERRIFGIRELGRILGEFSVEDPYMAAFGLVYLIGTDDEMAWLTKAGISVMNAAVKVMPWYMDTDEMDDDEYEEWIEGPTFNYNGWLGRTPSEERTDLNQPGEDGQTIAQRIYRLSQGIVPGSIHPFEQERREMKENGIREADFIADWSEALFLQSFHRRALNLEQEDWGETFKDWNTPGKTEGANDAADTEEVTEEMPEKNPELDRLKKENKNLRKAYSELKRETDSRIAKSEQELKTLRREHRELADLRELIFNRERDDAGEKGEAAYSKPDYPYETRKRTVIFGGHDTFLKAIRLLLPDVKYVDAKLMAFSPEIIRNADIVWIQNNCISHSQYWSIVKNCKQAGVQMRYFTHASAEKCADQLVKEDQR